METGRATMQRLRERLICLDGPADGNALWGFHFLEAVAAFYADGATSAQPALRRALSVRPGAGFDRAYPPDLEEVYLQIQAQVLQAEPAVVVAAGAGDPLGEVWVDGVRVGSEPVPLVPGEHLLQLAGSDGTLRGGFVHLHAGEVLAVGDPAHVGDALEELTPKAQRVVARWLRERLDRDAGTRTWFADGSGTVVPLGQASAGRRVAARDGPPILLLGVGGGYGVAERDSYGAFAIDVNLRIAGPMRVVAWARPSLGAIVTSPHDGARVLPVLVPFGVGPQLRFDGPVRPFVAVSVQLALDQEGVEAARLAGTDPTTRLLAGALLSGGVEIPLGAAPVAIAPSGEVGFLGRHPVARGLVSLVLSIGS